MRRESELLILGKRPPPIGGVTIHVTRLHDWLTYRQVPFHFMEVAGSRIWAMLQAVRRHRVVHLHGSNPVFLLIIATWSRLVGTRLIVTFHGDLARFKGMKNLFLRITIYLTAVPIVLNQGSYAAALPLNRHARLLSAFIPPSGEESLPSHIADEIRRRAHPVRPTFVTYAYDVAFDDSGKEIYGIVDVIKFCAANDYFLIVSDPSGHYQQYVTERISADVRGDVFFISEPHSLYALFADADIFIRNTTTDGDALSVREALYRGTQVWATDCVARPAGVRTYRTLNDIRCDSPKLPADSPPLVVDELVNLYQSLQ